LGRGRERRGKGAGSSNKVARRALRVGLQFAPLRTGQPTYDNPNTHNAEAALEDVVTHLNGFCNEDY